MTFLKGFGPFPIKVLPRTDWSAQHPTYRDAEPAIIDAALRRSQLRPSGNWYVFAASRGVRAGRPFGTTVAGVEVVAWRGVGGELHVGPGSCPHLGAELATGTVDRGELICPWHGLRLTGKREFGFKPLPSHDDGVLAWVRLDRAGGEEPLDRPVIPERPAGFALGAVMRLVGTCEPADVIANRLDPWHGGWYHPYSFTRLEVLSAPALDSAVASDRFVVGVTFRIGRFGVPVIAEFTSPSRRTIVMRIIDGEGAGSVVETHATPLCGSGSVSPRTAVIEAVLAHSDRSGFAHTRRFGAVIRPFMRYFATRLWRDDLAYAERRYKIRTLGSG
jgi:hypothetical protein